MKERRVVVTGMGVVSPLGHTIEQMWAAIQAGKSGIGPLTKFDTEGYTSKVAGEVRDFDPSLVMDRKEMRGMADFTIYAMYAAIHAMRDAGLDRDGEQDGYDPYKTGVYLGNGIGGFEVAEHGVESLLSRGPRAVPPMTIPKLIANEGAGNIAIRYGIKGPCATIVTACASGTDALGAAYQAISHGMVDLAVSGGAEGAITRLGVAGFCKIQALSTRYNDTPEKACRPFSVDRDGFILGEGAGILILEELEHARARGAHIYGEICGYGMTCDAYHLTAPNPEGDGAARAMLNAIADAGITPEDIDYINAHGTSTPVNDLMETKAIKQAFGAHAYTLKVSSTKSMTSHMVAAAGGIEAIISILAIRDGYYPCTLNLDHPDPECDLDYVPNEGVSGTIRYALSESLGFGGHNGALVIGKYEG
ncbi:MAG: beta-ketoacyl-ACP synthase II [Spirochaetia bacterium]|nr:beta-ketoacyl-ACP synthase II [Spirochaetia bacterium]